MVTQTLEALKTEEKINKKEDKRKVCNRPFEQKSLKS